MPSPVLGLGLSGVALAGAVWLGSTAEACAGWREMGAVEPPETPATAPKLIENPEPGAKSVAPAEEAKCLLIPLHGEIGKEVTATGVKAALAFAKRANIQNVVLDFDTPGGSLADGEAIGRQIHEASQGVTVHGCITEAYSAAMWAIVECDDLWVMPDARSGAAVAFKKSKGAGGKVDLEVDRKFNAALAARLAGRAEAHGYPGLVFRAMVEMPAEVWVAKSAAGEVQLFPSKPEGVAGAYCLDDAKSILALSADQMVELGIAKRVEAGTAKLEAGATFGTFGKLVDGKRFMVLGATEAKSADAAVERALKAAKDSQQALATQTALVRQMAQRAQEADPARLKVRTDRSGSITGESRQQWREATDRAVELWREVETSAGNLDAAKQSADATIKSLNDASARAQKVRLIEGTPEPVTAPAIPKAVDADSVRQLAESEIARLLQERDRSRQ